MILRVPCPPSKSMTQRALIIAALADGVVRVCRPLDCDDSRHLRTALASLGVRIEPDGDDLLVGPTPPGSGGVHLDLGNAGTAVRFVSCLSLILDGATTIDGNARMRARPIGPLVDGLRRIGVRARYLGSEGFPPIRLERGRAIGDRVRLDLSVSSQYASGLMMVAPLLDRGLVVEIDGDPVSRPYIRMTAEMMRRAGARVNWESPDVIAVRPGGYEVDRIDVEPDWSSASFLLAAAELSGSPLDVPDLQDANRSLQGDSCFGRILEELRPPDEHVVDLRDAPDLVAPLAAVALFRTHPTRIEGVAHARAKECDRVSVLATELSRLGGRIEESPDGLTVHPLDRAPSGPVRMHAHDDHRMAMAFGLVSLRIPSLTVDDPGCVSKSFPDFWELLGRFQR